MLVTTKCILVVAGCPNLRETILDLNSGHGEDALLILTRQQ